MVKTDLMTCLICHRPRDVHRLAEVSGEVNHVFSEDGSLVRTKVPTEDGGGERAPRLPSDPILRLLLAEKGLITVKELDEAEKKLRATGFLTT